jgi:hypothetical protein
VLQLLATADIVPGYLILFALKMEMIRSSETSVLTGATRRHIPEDDIVHRHRRGNLKSYIKYQGSLIFIIYFLFTRFQKSYELPLVPVSSVLIIFELNLITLV